MELLSAPTVLGQTFSFQLNSTFPIHYLLITPSLKLSALRIAVLATNTKMSRQKNGDFFFVL